MTPKRRQRMLLIASMDTGPRTPAGYAQQALHETLMFC